MIKALEIAVVLSAVDRMSQVFNSAVNASSAKLKEFQKQYQDNFKTGSILLGAGAAVGASLAPAIDAFAELEDSSERLKSVMLRDGGIVSENFEKINAIAIELGNRLPGTTADFQTMFAKLITGGVTEASIMNGVGQAAAYLAVGIKLPYEEAAAATAKLKTATGIADAQMLEFIDTIARLDQLDVSASEMRFAFARSAGALKLLNVQGLEASKSIGVVYAQLIRAGFSGETIGTGMTSVFNSFFDKGRMSAFNKEAAKFGESFEFIDPKSGQFKGVEDMIIQFEKLKKFNPQQRATLVDALLGPGKDASFMNILISNGVEGFNSMYKAMASQATLNDKVNNQLVTLKNVYEAMRGTFTNTLASFGKALAPELKMIANLFARIAVVIQNFSENHPKLMKFIALFIGITSVVMVLVGAFFIAKAAFFALTAVLMANPFILIAVGIIALVTAIYVYWDDIVVFFTWVWTKIKAAFMWAWEYIKKIPFVQLVTFIITNWSKIVDFFEVLWFRVKLAFVKAVIFVLTLGSRFFNAGKNIVKSIWEGIKSFASKPIEAIKAIVQKIRDHLPFSPAKEGPFKDLHRVKIIETIASNMKAAPMLTAMRKVTAAVRSQASPSGGGFSGGGSFMGGGVTLHYAPVINISGGGSVSDIKDSFASQLNAHKNDLLRMINEEMQRQKRVKF